MSFQTTAQQTFVGLGKAKRATFFSLFRKVIIVVPLTIILPKFFGIDGVMLAEPISNLVGGAAAYTTMRLTVFRELNTLKKKASL
jgi:Na+-driven multidrug efflux pump